MYLFLLLEITICKSSFRFPLTDTDPLQKLSGEMVNSPNQNPKLKRGQDFQQEEISRAIAKVWRLLDEVKPKVG